LLEHLNIDYLCLTIFTLLKTKGCVTGILLTLDVLSLSQYGRYARKEWRTV